MHETMTSVVSLEEIEIIGSQEFMPSEARLKFLNKMIIFGPKTAILGPQFCRILVLRPHFWWSGGGRPPLDPPLRLLQLILLTAHEIINLKQLKQTKIPIVHRSIPKRPSFRQN